MGKKSKISNLQINQGGGSMSVCVFDYEIKDVPDPAAASWGLLAHVSAEIRKKIMEAGFGEAQRHTDYIKKILQERGVL